MRVTLNELAERELNDAAQYYEHEQAGLGVAFLAEVRRCTQALVEHPESAPVRDAVAAITDYKRSAGDLVGVVDLLLRFVEAGTEQAADLGYGDETYFSTLERKLAEGATLLDALPDEARAEAAARFIRLGRYQEKIGWGYGDYLAETAARVQRRQSKPVRAPSR